MFIIQEIEAALQVFLDHSTVCDHHLRVQLVSELTEARSSCLVGYTDVFSAVLKLYVENRVHAIMHRGIVAYGECTVQHALMPALTVVYLIVTCITLDVNLLVPSTNPIAAYLSKEKAESIALQSERCVCVCVCVHE